MIPFYGSPRLSEVRRYQESTMVMFPEELASAARLQSAIGRPWIVAIIIMISP